MLLHLGDVMETVFCLSQCADEYTSISAAVRGNDALASFTLLGFVDGDMSSRDFIRRASGAFFVWPKALLDAELNCAMIANTVRHDLFDNNASGWKAYVAERRKDVAWFGEELPADVKSAAPAHASDEAKASGDDADSSRYSTWPWPNKSADA
ncbi:hypothetical protein BVER_06397c [Candidatus Burkholderia verschuerenii]|uniref:Uncharacterized protein n=2 Tax=Candidatus Burkholderia verschuerenii TaxID=242163 RepID=A0A0L0M8F7_9BURK|nr:hypothetical protein BVER_06397c [Candidatus Burkholderia verschuerenii]